MDTGKNHKTLHRKAAAAIEGLSAHLYNPSIGLHFYFPVNKPDALAVIHPPVDMPCIKRLYGLTT